MNCNEDYCQNGALGSMYRGGCDNHLRWQLRSHIGHTPISSAFCAQPRWDDKTLWQINLRITRFGRKIFFASMDDCSMKQFWIVHKYKMSALQEKRDRVIEWENLTVQLCRLSQRMSTISCSYTRHEARKNIEWVRSSVTPHKYLPTLLTLKILISTAASKVYLIATNLRNPNYLCGYFHQLNCLLCSTPVHPIFRTVYKSCWHRPIWGTG